jgi:lipid A 3-O-deacylase
MQEAIKAIGITSMIFLFGLQVSISQETINTAPQNQLQITHDNDFLVLTDRYYTFGLSLQYTRKRSKVIFSDTQDHIQFSLWQRAFTPKNIETTAIAEMDRPYAGLLSLNTKYIITHHNSYYEVGVLIGIVGPASGAGTFQQWYHDNIVAYKTPTWINESQNTFHTNFSFRYTKEWQWAPNPFGVRMAVSSELVVGTKDIYAQPEVQLFFGRRSSLSQSMAYSQLSSSERELYFSLQFAYRYVEENALLHFDHKENSIELTQDVLTFGFYFHHRHQKNEYRFGYSAMTRETSALSPHKYLTLAYALNF